MICVSTAPNPLSQISNIIGVESWELFGVHGYLMSVVSTIIYHIKPWKPGEIFSVNEDRSQRIIEIRRSGVTSKTIKPWESEQSEEQKQMSETNWPRQLLGGCGREWPEEEAWPARPGLYASQLGFFKCVSNLVTLVQKALERTSRKCGVLAPWDLLNENLLKNSLHASHF